jgi:hypothetical protein
VNPLESTIRQSPIRGTVRMTPIQFRAVCKCFGCGTPWIRDVASKMQAEQLLVTEGWKKSTSDGFAHFKCDVCSAGLSRARVNSKRRAKQQNRLLEILISGTEWNPPELQALLGGISRARLYQLREDLEKRGFIHPETKRVNVKNVNAWARHLNKQEREAQGA